MEKLCKLLALFHLLMLMYYKKKREDKITTKSVADVAVSIMATFKYKMLQIEKYSHKLNTNGRKKQTNECFINMLNCALY